MTFPFSVDSEAIASLCRRENIRRLAVFGSAARGETRPDSDVDLFVEFEPGNRLGLRFFGIEDELSRMIGRKVDLNTSGFLGPRLRNRIEEDIVPLYEAA